MPFCWFCHEVAQIHILIYCNIRAAKACKLYVGMQQAYSHAKIRSQSDGYRLVASEVKTKYSADYCCCVGVLRPFDTFHVISGAIS